jgi:hypothetical protein
MNTRWVFVGALVWALAVVLVVHFVKFPGSVPDFREVTRGGILLDASPAFTSDATYQRLAEYGEAGRRNYAFRNVTVDVLLPLSVLPFLVLLTFRAVHVFAPGATLRLMLLSLPFLYVAFDFIENATVLRLLAMYPDRMTLLAGTLPYVTLVKRAMSLFAIGLPVALIGFESMRRAFAKRRIAPS